ncbi:MAG: DUF2608 domain-containing protein [Chlamydiota bacterium]
MKFFTMIFVVLCGSLSGEIIEISNFEEIVNHITVDSIILCDIDDTILIPTQMLGSDEWFCALMKKHVEEGLSYQEALKESLDKWVMIRHVTKMQLVESSTASIIQDMQERGFSLMGLTTQGLTLMEKTTRHLEENGVFFEKEAPFSKDVYFEQPKRGEFEGVLYRKGVLFTGGAHKGKSFFTLCEKMGYIPKHIVFINDKATHLKEIEESAEERGIEFIGLRYAYSDAIKAKFSMEVAEAQFAHVPYRNILSDEEAIDRLGLVK